jgi:hypothetical protein
MTALKTLIAAVVIALILLVAFEAVSPSITARDVNTSASDVAGAGAGTLFAQQSCHFTPDKLTADAHAAATTQAASDHVTLTAFNVDSGQVVHVTVEKEARSIVAKHIKGLRKRYEISRSATAAPTGSPESVDGAPGRPKCP